MSDAEQSEILPIAPEQGEVVSARPAGAELQSRRSAGSLPAVQAAAAAAGGFVAGAAVVGLMGRHHRRRAALDAGRRSLLGRRSSRNAAPGERLQIVGSRSLLLDVHLLGGTGR